MGIDRDSNSCSFNLSNPKTVYLFVLSVLAKNSDVIFFTQWPGCSLNDHSKCFQDSEYRFLNFLSQSKFVCHICSFPNESLMRRNRQWGGGGKSLIWSCFGEQEFSISKSLLPLSLHFPPCNPNAQSFKRIRFFSGSTWMLSLFYWHCFVYPTSSRSFAVYIPKFCHWKGKKKSSPNRVKECLMYQN